MAIQLDELRALIATAGFEWEAGETSVANASSAPVPGPGFGLNMTPEEPADAKRRADYAQRGFMIPILPPRFDWRDHEGTNWLSPIRDQGGCGACVAFAATGVMEARVRIQRQEPNFPLELSTAHLFFCGAGQACLLGWNFDAALKYLRDQGGVGLEQDFPYVQRNQPCKSIKPVAKVTVWDGKAAIEARKQAIVMNGPVIAGMRVFDDFRYYRGGVYKHVGGNYLGQHAVGIVGYDDKLQAWILRNSWNMGWGDNGYAMIGYGECGLDNDFVFYDVHVEYSPAGL